MDTAARLDRQLATFRAATPDTRLETLDRVEVTDTAAIGAVVVDMAAGTAIMVPASIWVTHTMTITTAAITATDGVFADTDVIS